MKFNKIKDLKDNNKKEIKIKSNKVIKKKFFKNKIKDESKFKTKVIVPKNKEDVSANWLQMHDLIKNENKKKDNQKKDNQQKIKNNLKINKSNNDEKNLKRKEKFKLKRKLKRENAKLNKSNDKKLNDKKKSTIKKQDNLWFEVDQIYLDKAINPGKPAQPLKADDLIKKNATTGATKAIAIDCEMVGVGPRKLSALARISMVNQFGHTIYDKFVLPEEKITDYRTFVSGIRPEDLVNGIHIDIARKEVEDLIRGKILVGHAIRNDLNALGIKHPIAFIRDTSSYFKKMFNGKVPSLKRLSETLLNVKVQTGEHSSVEDAKATMRLYTLYKKDWEIELSKMKKHNKSK